MAECPRRPRRRDAVLGRSAAHHSAGAGGGGRRSCVVKDTDGAVFGDGDGWKRGLPVSRIAHQDWTTDLNVSAIGCNPDDFELVPLSVVVEHSVDHVNGTVLRVDGQSMNTTLQKIHPSCGVSGVWDAKAVVSALVAAGLGHDRSKRLVSETPRSAAGS